MDKQYEYCAYVDGGEAKLRYLINKKENFRDIFKLISVSISSEPTPYKQSIEELVKLVDYQRVAVENAIKYKYVVARIYKQHKWSELLQNFLYIVDRVIAVEFSTYQVLLNHLACKTELKDKRKIKKRRQRENKDKYSHRNHDWDDDWV